VALLFAAPDDIAGGGFVGERLTLFPPLVLLPWLAGGRFPRAWRWGVIAAAVLLAGRLLALCWGAWSEVNRNLEDYLAVARRVEDGRTVVPLAFDHQVRDDDGVAQPFRVFPYLHAIGYEAATRPIVSLGLYEAGTDLFPLRYRPERDPYRHLPSGSGCYECAPPGVDLAQFEAATGERIDYVIVWQPDRGPVTLELLDVRTQLTTLFERAAVSPRGLAELWRRKPTPPPGPAAPPTGR
jgi:hypothetical protein